MARLRSKHKRFIVKRLAMFVPPSEVQDEVRDEFGIDVDSSQLAHYDPTNKKGQGLAEDLKTYFHEHREAFLEGDIGTALRYKAVRLLRLEKMERKLLQKIDDLEDMDHHLGVVDILADLRDTYKQIAKESGGKYTNRTELTGKDGGPVQYRDVTLSDAELAKIAAEDGVDEALTEGESHENGHAG